MRIKKILCVLGLTLALIGCSNNQEDLNILRSQHMIAAYKENQKALKNLRAKFAQLEKEAEKQVSIHNGRITQLENEVMEMKATK